MLKSEETEVLSLLGSAIGKYERAIAGAFAGKHRKMPGGGLNLPAGKTPDTIMSDARQEARRHLENDPQDAAGILEVAGLTVEQRATAIRIGVLKEQALPMLTAGSPASPDTALVFDMGKFDELMPVPEAIRARGKLEHILARFSGDGTKGRTR